MGFGEGVKTVPWAGVGSLSLALSLKGEGIVRCVGWAARLAGTARVSPAEPACLRAGPRAQCCLSSISMKATSWSHGLITLCSVPIWRV